MAWSFERTLLVPRDIPESHQGDQAGQSRRKRGRGSFRAYISTGRAQVPGLVSGTRLCPALSRHADREAVAPSDLKSEPGAAGQPES